MNPFLFPHAANYTQTQTQTLTHTHTQLTNKPCYNLLFKAECLPFHLSFQDPKLFNTNSIFIIPIYRHTYTHTLYSIRGVVFISFSFGSALLCSNIKLQTLESKGSGLSLNYSGFWFWDIGSGFLPTSQEYASSIQTNTNNIG